MADANMAGNMIPLEAAGIVPLDATDDSEFIDPLLSDGFDDAKLPAAIRGLDSDDPDNEGPDRQADNDPPAQQRDDQGRFASQQQADGDDEGIASIEELAQALEVTPAEVLQTLKHTVKVGDEDRELSLQELIDSYGQGQDFTIARQEMDTQNENIRGQLRQVYEGVTHQVNAVQGVEGAIVEWLDSQLASPHMQSLMVQAPQQYADSKAWIDLAKGHIQQSFQGAGQQYAAGQQHQQRGWQEDMESTLRREVEGWGPTKRNEAVKVMQEAGFRDDEIQGGADTRHFKLALELTSLRAENAQLKGQRDAGTRAADKVRQRTGRRPLTLRGGPRTGQGESGGNRGGGRQNMARLVKQRSQENNQRSGISVEEAARFYGQDGGADF